MCFTDFPTETHAEAVETLDFLRARREALAVYIVGEFGLTHGSLVAQTPERFGIDEVFALEGDELGLGLFFVPREPWKTDAERADVDARLSDLSRGWTLRSYPWAGAVSTAHTILQYDRFGPGVFRDRAARRPDDGIPGASAIERGLRFDPRAAEHAEAREAEIWATLVHEERRVGRDAYERLARSLPPLRPRPVRVRFVAGAAPAVTSGRRPSHASSAAR